MALNADQVTLLAAARTYLTAWETYLDTAGVTDGSEIRFMGLDIGDTTIGDHMRTTTVAGTDGSGNNLVVRRHVADGDTVLQIENPGGLVVPLAWFATNAANDTA